MLSQNFITRLSTRYQELSEADKQKISGRVIPKTQKAMVTAFSLYANMVERGTNKDELVDPNSPFNMENVRASIENQDKEFSFIYDKDGRLIGWAKGDEGSVKSGYIPGSLRGGVDIHNHPTKVDRPLGMSYSPADFISYHTAGTAVGIVYAREGEYRVTMPPDFDLKHSKKSVEIAANTLEKTYSMIVAVMNESIYGKMDKSRNEAFMAGAKMMNEETKKLCDSFGIKFEFKPNKGFEWLSGSGGPPPKDLPAFKTVDSRTPHLDNFKPNITTARGFKVGEAVSVKPPRKPRTKTQEPPPSNYYRI